MTIAEIMEKDLVHHYDLIQNLIALLMVREKDYILLLEIMNIIILN